MTAPEPKQQALRSINFAGRYNITQPLATGGMAEIFLARQEGRSGFEKDVVIKILKDRYRNDARVVEMFLEEARIGAVLNHPNIVHVYDVGEDAGAPFIAMEYIRGEELANLCRRGLELGNFLPLEHAVDLVRQAAVGMGHFHHKRTAEGDELEIVHRDISPSNLLVTTDGFLKVIDFGIARAQRAGRREEDGLVPGKYNYMSPEQVRGEKVDQRSDIFSLGIVLYEITVGRRLFKGPPQEVMQRITKTKPKPPTFVKREFPPALEQIVLRALEMHPEDRYQSAYELANDLEEFLRDAKLETGPVRIAQYLDELASASGGEGRPELAAAGKAWVDDDSAEILDFDRPLAPHRSPARVAAKKPAPVRPADDEDDEGSDEIAPAPARVTPRPARLVEPLLAEPTVVDPHLADPLALSADPLPPPPTKHVEPALAPQGKAKRKPAVEPLDEKPKPVSADFGAGVLATRKAPNVWPVVIGVVIVGLIALVIFLLKQR